MHTHFFHDRFRPLYDFLIRNFEYKSLNCKRKKKHINNGDDKSRIYIKTSATQSYFEINRSWTDSRTAHFRPAKSTSEGFQRAEARLIESSLPKAVEEDPGLVKTHCLRRLGR